MFFSDKNFLMPSSVILPSVAKTFIRSSTSLAAMDISTRSASCNCNFSSTSDRKTCARMRSVISGDFSMPEVAKNKSTRWSTSNSEMTWSLTMAAMPSTSRCCAAWALVAKGPSKKLSDKARVRPMNCCFGKRLTKDFIFRLVLRRCSAISISCQCYPKWRWTTSHLRHNVGILKRFQAYCLSEA